MMPAFPAASYLADGLVIISMASICDDCIVLRSVSYTHLRAHETVLDLVCRLLLEKKKHKHYENLKQISNQHLTSTNTDKPLRIWYTY